jgi:hypothetical protein
MVFGMLIVGLSTPALAADFRSGSTVIIAADEVIDDDLFVSGNRVEVNGTVKGDLFAVGETVEVNGPVEGSLMISGQTLTVNGPVGGSIYSGGYALRIGPEVEVSRNLYFGGFSLTTASSSSIGRSLYVGAYQASLNGEIQRDLSVGLGALELNGVVGGDVEGEVSRAGTIRQPVVMPPFGGAVEPIEPGLRISDGAEIGGQLTVQEVQRDQTPDPGATLALGISRAVSRRVGEFIALLLVGFVLLRFGPGLIERAGSEITEQPLPSISWGLLITLAFFILVPIAALVIFVLAALGGLITFGQLFGDILTIGGAALTLVVAAFVFVLSLVTKIIVTFVLGKLALSRLAPQLQPGFSTNFLALILGVVGYEIVRAIPLGLGWLVGVIVTLIGLGAIYLVVQRQVRPASSGPVVAQPAV